MTGSDLFFYFFKTACGWQSLKANHEKVHLKCFFFIAIAGSVLTYVN